MSPSSDQPGTTTIVRRVQDDGSDESWKQFVMRYEYVIVEYAIAAGLRHDQAEDLRQSVFVELIKILPSLTIDPNRGSFRSILRTIVKRRTIDLIRLHYRDADLKAHLSALSVKKDTPEWDLAWETGLMKQTFSEVAQLVNPDTFQAFELTTTYGVPAKEVARLLGMTVDSVYQSKSRIKASADKIYKRLLDEADGHLDQHSS